MTGYLILPDGTAFELPRLTAWEALYTSGDGADSFEVTFAYRPEMATMLHDAFRFRATEAGKTVFYGVVDDFQVRIDAGGAFVCVSGRGLAALLLDNESESVEYGACTLEDILRVHVRPCGISDILTGGVGSLYGYRVPSSVSQWRALCDFTKWAGGITPRFSKEGRLLITKEQGVRVSIDERSGVCAARWKKRRYGVVSQVLVKGNTSGEKSTVANQAFINKGGSCRRVVCVPNSTGCDAMRYTGEYQIRESERGAETVELSLAEPFFAFAGDAAAVSLPHMGILGDYSITRSRAWADGEGCGTVLSLTPKKGLW